MKTEEQVRKCFSDVNRKHIKVFRRFNSPIETGDTEAFKHAQFKWLERFAGFIQALRWVLNDDEKMPEQFDAIKKYEL
jgi:hypothetical protein